jgi:serine protease Do
MRTPKFISTFLSRLTTATVCLAILFGFLGGVVGYSVSEAYLFPRSVVVVPGGPIEGATTTPAVIPEIPRVTRLLGIEQDLQVYEASQRALPAVVRLQVGKVTAGAIVLSADGWLVTSRSAVERGGAIQAFIGTTEYPVVQRVMDGTAKVAFLKINAQNLPVASLGDSDEETPGQLILALQPAPGVRVLTLEETTVQFVPDAVDTSESFTTGFLADLEVGPAYIGGPALNLAGEVIGVFASGRQIIPVNQFRFVVGNVLRSGATHRPSLGIQTKRVVEAQVIGDQITRKPVPTSAAGRAGLLLNDIIVRVEGQAVSKQTTLVGLIQQYHPGDVIALDIMRQGEAKKVSVTLDELPAEK